MTEYYESCYECYSINLTVKIIDGFTVEVTCSECGTSWVDERTDGNDV